MCMWQKNSFFWLKLKKQTTLQKFERFWYANEIGDKINYHWLHTSNNHICVECEFTTKTRFNAEYV